MDRAGGEERLTRKHPSWAFVCSIASSLQGEPRATNDIDIAVAMLPHRVREFAERLGPDFEVDQEPHLDMWAQRLRVHALLERARTEAMQAGNSR